ncbi:hypothetical protein EBS67_00370 [bacterium]|nr:hypothetical protein [bacterium]NBT60204.1 hypothetical protein [Planctomycetia bacterium]
MSLPENVTNPVTSPQAMQERLKIGDGESLEDLLSLYDAMSRYGVSRTALRDAVLSHKLSGEWVGGMAKKSLYMRRKDIIEYVSRPMSQTNGRRSIPWRIDDRMPSLRTKKEA